jgi:hypothetical protein
MAPDLFLKALRLLTMKIAEKRLIPWKFNFWYDIQYNWKCLELIFLPKILKWVMLNTFEASNQVSVWFSMKKKLFENLFFRIFGIICWNNPSILNRIGIFCWTKSLRMDLILNICVLGNWIEFFFYFKMYD